MLQHWIVMCSQTLAKCWEMLTVVLLNCVGVRSLTLTLTEWAYEYQHKIDQKLSFHLPDPIFFNGSFGLNVFLQGDKKQHLLYFCYLIYMFLSAPLLDNYVINLIIYCMLFFFKFFLKIALHGEKSLPVITVCLIRWNGQCPWLVLYN